MLQKNRRELDTVVSTAYYFKTTWGFVSQVFDTDGQSLSQSFTAGDDFQFEDDKGDYVESDDVFDETPEAEFDMVNPDEVAVDKNLLMAALSAGGEIIDFLRYLLGDEFNADNCAGFKSAEVFANIREQLERKAV